MEVWLNGNVTIHGCMVLVCNQLRGPTEHSTVSGMGNKHQPSGSGSALAGKETIGLASHLPCVRLCSITTYGFNGLRRLVGWSLTSLFSTNTAISETTMASERETNKPPMLLQQYGTLFNRTPSWKAGISTHHCINSTATAIVPQTGLGCCRWTHAMLCVTPTLLHTKVDA